MPVASSLSQRFPNAVIAHANCAQFTARQTILNPCVKSRMIVWCKAGTGVVTANGSVCPFETGRYLLLPWGHSIKYEASSEDPFFVGGIHIIPDHRTDHAVTFDVAHHDRHPLAQASFRRDLKIRELPRLKLGWLDAQAPLGHLLEYIMRVFVRKNPGEWMARWMARQLLCELIFSEQRSEVHDHGIPPEIERMKQFIAFHLARPLSLRDLVEFTKLSPSTVGRLFREHLKTTPVTWILRMKTERAKTLLRTRRLSIADVGASVGIPDPYYFSKCFKKETGRSPLEYRRQVRWI